MVTFQRFQRFDAVSRCSFLRHFRTRFSNSGQSAPLYFPLSRAVRTPRPIPEEITFGMYANLRHLARLMQLHHLDVCLPGWIAFVLSLQILSSGPKLWKSSRAPPTPATLKGCW